MEFLSRLRRSVVFRLFIVGLMSLFLMIPMLLIILLIDEREARRNGAVAEVSGKWGDAQLVAGPVLTVPYKKYYTDEKGNSRVSRKYAHFLPDSLAIKSDIATEIRYRGIYEVVLYNSKLKYSGVFADLDTEALGVNPRDFVWEDATVTVGVSDMKGIRSPVSIIWDGRSVEASPGIISSLENVLRSGMSARVGGTSMIKGNDFSFEIDLNGSENLMFVPLGKETTASAKSSWVTPSFSGEFLPVNRNVGPEGFEASWKVLHYNRNYPQQWIDKDVDINPSAFGVKLLLPVDAYQKGMRTAKYAILFIFLTFLSFFMVEVLNKKDLHPVQYLLVGAALVLFYALLVSLSEHIQFGYAYLAASSVMIAVVGMYARVVISSDFLAAVISSLLAALYGFLYIILQLEDYALLLGSAGLFAILSGFMYLTRNIDWFNVWKQEGPQQ